MLSFFLTNKDEYIATAIQLVGVISSPALREIVRFRFRTQPACVVGRRSWRRGQDVLGKSSMCGERVRETNRKNGKEFIISSGRQCWGPCDARLPSAAAAAAAAATAVMRPEKPPDLSECMTFAPFGNHHR